MALSVEDRKKIIQQSESWLDSEFGGLDRMDLSGFPHLQEPPQEKPDPFANDLECGVPRTSMTSLRGFVDNPDIESLQRVAEESGNKNLLSEIRDEKAAAVVRQFKAQNPDYVEDDENRDNLVDVLAHNLLPNQDGDVDELMEELVAKDYWTCQNLTSAWRALKGQGLAILPRGTARELTQAELLHVVRIAQQGGLIDAIGQFLKYALDDEDPSMNIVHDPAYRGVCDRAVLYVFEVSQTDYSPTPERREYFRRFAAGRPLTISLLQSAWASCQRHEEANARQSMLGSFQRPRTDEPVTQQGLDDLSDDAIEALYRGTRREIARSSRRGAGVLA